MSCKRFLTVASAFALLAGCAAVDPQTGSADPRFGEATRWNAAAQIIDPAPVYDETGAQPGDSGAKAAAAAERYRTDRVKEPRRESTSTNATSGRPPSGGGPQ